jgi:uncharacterized protein (TIGR02145 family)
MNKICDINVETFADHRDGNVYKIVKIGNQVWMAENLNYDALGSKCYKNDIANSLKYGRLYNWETAKKACPSGWHLPSDAEWQTLVDFVGGQNMAGKKLKAKNGWTELCNGTDDYHFSALPGGGIRSSSDFFEDVGNVGYWWSGTEDNRGYVYIRYIASFGKMSLSDVITRLNDIKTYMYSIRCIKD